MARKLRTKFDYRHKPALIINRRAVRAERLVYVACANRPSKYRHGRSCIVYIGTTQAGAKRIADSAASKAGELLRLPGVKSLQFYVVVCSPLPGVPSWELLERALLLRFRMRFGDLPKCNTVGKNLKWDQDEKYFKHFTTKALDKIIKEYN